jgi:Asp-tRNA(Asn)/Glu-tRNA(Gln) amidotransferase B subunit
LDESIIATIAKEVLSENPKEISNYKAGKRNYLAFL